MIRYLLAIFTIAFEAIDFGISRSTEQFYPPLDEDGNTKVPTTLTERVHWFLGINEWSDTASDQRRQERNPKC